MALVNSDLSKEPIIVQNAETKTIEELINEFAMPGESGNKATLLAK